MTTPEAAAGALRPMSEHDLVQVLAWRNHESVRRFMLTRHEIAADEHRRWFERESADPGRRLLVFEQAGEALGFVHFSGVRRGGIAEWGFYAAPDAPRGSGRRMGQAALGVGFDEFGLHKIRGEVLAFNAASIRFHRALGFRQEGVLREQHFDGRAYHDLVCFGLLQHEWSSTLAE